jgi:hypothetical protein
LKKKGYKKLGITLIVGILFFLIYNIYIAVNPSDNFYYSEFKEVTLREIPKSAKILFKHASYPDFHGDYCSASLISLSNEDYSKLLDELNKDSLLIKKNPNEIVGNDELSKVINNLKKEKIVHGFKKVLLGEEDHYLFIGTLNDKKAIVVNVCMS